MYTIKMAPRSFPIHIHRETIGLQHKIAIASHGWPDKRQEKDCLNKTTTTKELNDTGMLFSLWTGPSKRHFPSILFVFILATSSAKGLYFFGRNQQSKKRPKTIMELVFLLVLFSSLVLLSLFYFVFCSLLKSWRAFKGRHGWFVTRLHWRNVIGNRLKRSETNR